jgi:hypothetical protein
MQAVRSILASLVLAGSLVGCVVYGPPPYPYGGYYAQPSYGFGFTYYNRPYYGGGYYGRSHYGGY